MKRRRRRCTSFAGCEHALHQTAVAAILNGRDGGWYDHIPYMALKGDYTGSSMVCQDAVNAINARRADKLGTAKAEYLKLDEMGMLGVTHMMMLDRRNLEIADVILGWVNRNVRGNRERRRSTD